MQNQEQTIDQLNSFLRGELSAAETYRQALEKLSSSPHRSTLDQVRRSHKDRASLLAQEVQRLGGTPAESSGAWGGFNKLLTKGAALVGEKAAIAVLEQGEDHGRDDYQRDLKDIDPTAQRLVQDTLLPEQLRTHDTMSALKKGFVS